MTTDSIREYCLGLPHATEDIKWGHDLCFLIGEKIFASACLDMTVPYRLSFKCTPEKFAELIEVDGIIPAPYMARNHWVTIQRFDALRDPEIKELVHNSYELVLAKLPKRLNPMLGMSVGTRVGKKSVVKKKSAGRKKPVAKNIRLR